MTSNQQASLLHPQVARLDQLNARRNLQYEALRRRCWKIRNSLSQVELQSSQAQQTIARMSQALILASKSQIEAARHVQCIGSKMASLLSSQINSRQVLLVSSNSHSLKVAGYASTS